MSSTIRQIRDTMTQRTIMVSNVSASSGVDATLDDTTVSTSSMSLVGGWYSIGSNPAAHEHVDVVFDGNTPDTTYVLSGNGVIPFLNIGVSLAVTPNGKVLVKASAAAIPYTLILDFVKWQNGNS